MSDLEKVEDNKDEKKNPEKVSVDSVNLKHSTGACNASNGIGPELSKFYFQRAGAYFDLKAGNLEQAFYEGIQYALKDII